MSAINVDKRIIEGLRASADALDAAAKNLVEIAAVVADPTKGLITDAVERSGAAAAEDQARTKSRMYYRISELAGAALTTDGAHHKQWFLEEIYRELGLDPDSMDHPRGVAP